MNNPLISICLAHYKRSDLLRRTLASIEYQSSKPSFEVVIVNDTDGDQDLVDVCKTYLYKRNFGGNIRLFNTGRAYKYRGPSPVWNAAVKQAKGEIIILQSPEVMHVGPLMFGLSEVVKARQGKPCYVAARCVESNKDDLDYLDEFEPKCYLYPEMLNHMSWPHRQEYCGHKMRNKQPFYFCAAMTRQNYIDIGGLDEAIQFLAYDDDLFLYTIRKAGFEIVTPYDAPYWALHLFHAKIGTCDTDPNFNAATSHSYQVANSLIYQMENGLKQAKANIGRKWGILSENSEIIL